MQNYTESREAAHTLLPPRAVRLSLKRILSSPAFITIIAYLVRMGILMHSHRIILNPVRDNLPFGYELGAVASSIASGEGFASPLRWFHTGPTAWFGPIYPYLAAGVFKLFGIYSYMSYAVLQTVNCAFSALTCIPIYLAGRRSFGTGVGIGAAWLWVLLPNALLFPLQWIWDTSLSALWMALLLYATLKLRETTRLANWMGYGALWAIGALINPALLSVLPAFGIWLIFQLRKRELPWLRVSVMGALVFCAGIAPWTIRNYIVFHQFVPLRSNFGLELWLGNNPGSTADDTPYQHPDDNLQEAEQYRQMGEPAYMALKQQEALHFMRSNPADDAALTLHRFASTWLGASDPFQDTWARENWAARSGALFQVAFSLLALWGLLLGFRSHNADTPVYALALLLYPAVFYLTHASLRYRHPIDPIMILLAASAVAYPFRAYARNLREAANVRQAGARDSRNAARAEQLTP